VTTSPLLGVWEFDGDEDLDEARAIAAEHMVPADLRAALLSSHGDRITLQVVEGRLTRPGALLYVEGRGFFVLARSAQWLAAPGEDRGRSLLTLRQHRS